MVISRSHPIRFPLNVSSFVQFSLSPYSILLHSLTLRCLYRRLGFECHDFLDSDSCSDEHVLEHEFLPPSSENPVFPMVNRDFHASHNFSTDGSTLGKYSFDRKWCKKEILMKRITLALSKQGWDLNFLTSFGIELNSQCFPRILNDLFDESLDSALVYNLFRMWRRLDDNWEQKLELYCTMVHIAVSGNMNHIAMNLIREIVRSYETVEGGPKFIFHALWQARRNRRELETVYSMLAICFAEWGMLDIATELITWMEKFGFCPSNGVYVAISFLLKSQFTIKFESDRNLFLKLQSWGARLSGLTLSLLIREFCSHGCLEAACKLLYYIPTFGGKADSVTYTILIVAFCKRGCLKEATSMLFKMTQMGLPLDSTLISSLVHAYCKAGRPEAAMDILNFSACVPDAFMYNSFILTYCQNGEVESAHKLLNLMFVLNVTPDSVNFTTVIKGYCKLNQINYALTTFAQMLKKGIKPTIVTYSVLIEGHCKNDDIEGAEFVFKALERDGFHADVVTFNTLINGYSKKGHMHKAYELLDMMKMARVSPDSVTYNIMLHGLVKRGFGIEMIFNELVRRGYSPDEFYLSDNITCTNIIHGYSKEGRLGEAYLIWCSMSKRGMTPDVVTCSALLNGFCKMHQMQDADELFHKMLDAGLVPDLILYNTLVHGFCNIGDVNKAGQLLAMMKGNDIFPNDITRSALTTGLEKNGVEDAQESAAKLLQHIFSME